ncbi:MAG: putative bifunctional diguanylate cyclase/phosphodiesterase, partial [Anaerovoracaceae bacterium]
DKVENVSLQWGIYEITDRSTSVEQMCDRALLAVDSIKGQYNQTVAIYDDALRGRLLREKAITDVMETALAEGQFVVYYQPKYCLKDSSMAGAEALVRWIHPEWGFMSPGEFIPLFEKNGFIPSLDRYVWEKVCAQLKDWKAKGYPVVPVSVNVSRADVYQPHLADTLLEITRKYDVEPSLLHLEITESAYAENPGQIFATVDQFRKLGFTIEMDDFGSGYSSLNMLNQMKLDILKLDMEFIRNELAKPAEQSILHYVISMAHGMGLVVVAEGVETREQVERLQDIGCDLVQGYFFARPMPAAELETLLKA